MRYSRQEIERLLDERVLILDGATGTYLQQFQLKEEDFRGSLFSSHPVPLKGCNDVLCLTRPELVRQMHRAYLDAGADIIETNTFNSNRFSLGDYGLEDRVYEIARAGAALGREVADAYDRPRLVAGSMGPTNKTLSISGNVNDPGARDISFRELYDTYREQARGLIDGGCDVLLIETVFDTLNAKCAMKAIIDLCEERGEDIPVMVSATLSDASGRTLSGQTIDAFVASMSHGPLLSIGLNCGFGAKQLLPYISRLDKIAPCRISVHPNAGLPNVMGTYDETPETFAQAAIDTLSAGGRINIYGGCCGTTPAHIRALSKAVESLNIPRERLATPKKPHILPMTLSGLELLTVERTTADGTDDTPQAPPFINVGERTNVAGSAKFKKLIQARDYEAALSVARQQVERGAQVIDICMDDGLIDGVEAMTTFLRLIAAEPDIARVPVMIDSSRWDVIKAGLENVQGKPIVNSISLKEGEEPFLRKARHIKSMGAATVVMLFDEEGQADTYDRKVTVARRAYRLLKDIGFPTEDIIFDPNVLAVATGMPEHDDYARAFIEACRTIHREMPEVHMSGGISNLSFSFRGNNTIRQAMHSVFLHHAMQAGLDMSIVNPAMTTRYEDIPKEMLQVVEDVILNSPLPASNPLPASPKGEETGTAGEPGKTGISGEFGTAGTAGPTAAERLIEYAEQVKAADEARKAAATGTTATPQKTEQTPRTAKERIAVAMLKGLTDNIEADTLEAYQEAGTALGVIDNYLMPAMEQVGQLFGEGKMFLPQVVKSARVMKKAVAALEPYMKSPLPASPLGEGTGTAGTPGEPRISGTAGKTGTTATPGASVLMATVKGDVHDIGKNIVAVVTQCNGFHVEDLGVMVDTDTIVDAAQKHNIDVIGLSGLITPSLDEMIKVCEELQRRGMTTPVIVGGATTSALHTALKMAPAYPDGVVIHSHSAADNPAIIRRLMADDREEYIAEQKNQQRIVRENYQREQATKTAPLSLEEARQRRYTKKATDVAIPREAGPIDLHLTVSDIADRIDWSFFYQAWGLKGEQRHGEEATKLRRDAEEMLKLLDSRIPLLARAHILPATSDRYDNIIITKDGTQYPLPMPRSRRTSQESGVGETTHCLADHIMRDGVDFICPFIVCAGRGLRELQDTFRQDGDEYRAIMAKLLCDRLAEALAETLADHVVNHCGWGKSVIRFAFGYGACPDHKLKVPVLEMLGVGEEDGISLTSSYMINPGESICGLLFANTPKKYFNV